MPVIFIDPNDENEISTIHIAERLESSLLLAKENVEDMELNILFMVESRLPSGKIVGQPYLDINNPLQLSCKDNPELAKAMQVIQKAIREGRYKQIITPKEVVEPSEPFLPM